MVILSHVNPNWSWIWNLISSTSVPKCIITLNIQISPFHSISTMHFHFCSLLRIKYTHLLPSVSYIFNIKSSPLPSCFPLYTNRWISSRNIAIFSSFSAWNYLEYHKNLHLFNISFGVMLLLKSAFSIQKYNSKFYNKMQIIISK